MQRVQDKVAVVTGAAAGIGRACAIRLAENGARVAVTDLQDQAGRELVDDLNARGLTAAYWHLDVSREAECATVMDEVWRTFGGIDVLVNNAGIGGSDKPTHELAEEEWDAVHAVNVKGVFFCTKHAVPIMQQRGGGSIVNLSSVYGLVGSRGLNPYHASKGAVRMMSKTDALTYARDRIRVNSVHPSFIWTPLVEAQLAGKGDPEKLRAMLDRLHPIGHVGKPDDVAWAVVYLASDESGFVTGSELVVDGGYTAQ